MRSRATSPPPGNGPAFTDIVNGSLLIFLSPS
jgi:hypothetical protein